MPQNEVWLETKRPDRALLFAIAVCVLSLPLSPIYAETTNATLSGTIMDPAGRVVLNGKVNWDMT